MNNQTELNFIDEEPKPAQLTLGTIPYGRSVIVTATGKMIAKVRPRGFMLNSNLVSDVLNRGDCFVVNMITGDLTVLSKDTLVS